MAKRLTVPEEDEEIVGHCGKSRDAAAALEAGSMGSVRSVCGGAAVLCAGADLPFRPVAVLDRCTDGAI